MPPVSLRPPPPWLQAGLLLLATLAVTALLFGRAGWADWGRPHWLEGDPVEVYARVKIAAEQPGHALLGFSDIARLGAPVTADWSAYPVPDRLVFVLTGLLARVTGLIAAVHLAAAALAGLNAVSFYLCARWLRWRWEWAAALALVFAFSTHNVRWGITLSLSQTFALPPLVLLCARATRGGALPSRRSRLLLLATGLGLWLGLANPYLAFFAGAVGGGALLLAWLRRRPAARWRPLPVFLGCLAGVFLLGHADRISVLLAGDAGPALARGAEDLRTYALRPAGWIVPPADHRIPALAALGHDYQAARPGAGEFFYNYLGLAGLAGAGLLVGAAGRGLMRRRWPPADALLGIGWITAFGVAGGINTWLGAAGLDLFRAGSRIGVFALVWALLHLGGTLARGTRGWPRAASVLLALGLAAAAVWEQTPPLAGRAVPARHLERWEAAAALTARLERDLPAGAMVFQLPSVPFPEAGRTGGMPDYEHFLPFLTSSSLRFSYGQLRGSRVLRWADHVARRPADALVAALEQAGFAALWIDRQAGPEAAAALARRLRELGRAELAAPTPLLPVHVFRLQPAARSQAPDFDDPRLNEAWDDTAAVAGLFALAGWYPPERDHRNRWRWAGARARLGCWRDGPAARATLRCRVGGPGHGTVVLRHDGREVWRGHPGPVEIAVPLDLAAGFNVLDWTLEGRTFRPGDHDPRELGFMVENLSLSVP